MTISYRVIAISVTEASSETTDDAINPTHRLPIWLDWTCYKASFCQIVEIVMRTNSLLIVGFFFINDFPEEHILETFKNKILKLAYMQ